MSITPEEVAHTARLARLKLTDDQLARFAHELARITEYIDHLREAVAGFPDVDVPRREADSRCSLRPDVVDDWFDSSRVIKAAPATKGNLFKVPKVIG